MPISVKRTTNGFERVGNLLGNIPSNGKEYELTPSTAFAAGDMVVLTNGLVAAAAASATNVLGVMAETIALADNPATGGVKGRVYDNPFDIFRCSISDARDAAATGGTTATLIDTAIGVTADDRWIGAILYIYEGPGKGDLRTISDYEEAAKTFTVTKLFSAAPTTATKYLLFGAAAAAGDVINIGSIGVNIKTKALIDGDATTAGEAGPLAVLDINPAELTMDVLIRKHRFNTP